MNHCSHWTRFYGHPAYRDFALHGEGLRYLFPEENEGIIFDDGSSFIGFSASRVVDAETGRQERSEENIRRTWEQISRFSRRDADAYLELLEAYERHWKPAFRRHRFSVPPAWGTPDPLEELIETPGALIEPVHQFMTLRQLAQDFFESPELQILFMRASTTSTGCFPDDVPGLQGLLHCLPLTLSFEPAAIAVGGSQAITDALVSAGGKLGVEYRTGCEVDRITVAGGRATGVSLTDGSHIAAGLVVSDLGLSQTVLRLLGDVSMQHRVRRRIENIHYDRGQLLWANLAIAEAPRYLAERRQPRRRVTAAPVLGREGPRLPPPRLPARDLPARLRAPPLRAVLGRQPVGHEPRAGRGAHRRGRGVLRPAAVLRRARVARHRERASSTICCVSGRGTPPT